MSKIFERHMCHMDSYHTFFMRFRVLSLALPFQDVNSNTVLHSCNFVHALWTDLSQRKKGKAKYLTPLGLQFCCLSSCSVVKLICRAFPRAINAYKILRHATARQRFSRISTQRCLTNAFFCIVLCDSWSD